MNLLKQKSPRFFRSLLESCYSGSFYADIENFSWKSSLLFVLYLAITIAIIVLLSVLLFLSRVDLSSESILEYYDRYVPEFQASYVNDTLSIEPKKMLFSIYLDEYGGLIVKDTESSYTQILISVNTDKSIAEAVAGEELNIGLYVYKDGIYATNGFQSTVSRFSEIDYEFPEKQFGKEQLRLIIKAFAPIAISWLWKWGTIGAAMLAFVYTFFGAWLLALIFSVFGVLSLLIMRKKLDYGFLIKLSLYSMIPAIIFWLISSMLLILVPWLPIIIYAAYYYFGLRVYRS